jgi:hypothetical protein
METCSCLCGLYESNSLGYRKTIWMWNTAVVTSGFMYYPGKGHYIVSTLHFLLKSHFFLLTFQFLLNIVWYFITVCIGQLYVTYALLFSGDTKQWLCSMRCLKIRQFQYQQLQVVFCNETDWSTVKDGGMIIGSFSLTEAKKCVKAQIIINHCNLSLSKLAGTVHVRTVCNLNSLWVKAWFIEQPKVVYVSVTLLQAVLQMKTLVLLSCCRTL